MFAKILTGSKNDWQAAGVIECIMKGSYVWALSTSLVSDFKSRLGNPVTFPFCPHDLHHEDGWLLNLVVSIFV